MARNGYEQELKKSVGRSILKARKLAVRTVLKRDEVKKFLEDEQLRLMEIVPQAVDNVKELVNGMRKIDLKDYGEKELSAYGVDKRLGYEATRDSLKMSGIMSTEPSSITNNFYQKNQFIISPIVQEIINRHVRELEFDGEVVDASEVEETEKSDGDSRASS
jgi:hypothetical protein